MALPNTSTLMTALGSPSMGGTTKPAAKKATYLDSKPAQLRGYLEDATDSTLSPDARAEALCRAIEFSGSDEDAVDGGADDATEQDNDSDY